MPIHNIEIAALLNQLADLLEINEENPFRVRAYRNAALTISSLSKNATDLVAEKRDLSELPGIGSDLAEKIKTIIKTGELPLLNQIKKKLPPILSELLKIEGLGPKRVRLIYKKLKITSVDELKNKIEQGALRKLTGFGQKTEEKILNGIQHIKEYSARTKLAAAFFIENSLVGYLKLCPDSKQIECAGSFRRKKETVGDLDILVSAKNSKKVMNHFLQFEEIDEILSRGSTRATVRLHSGIQVDLRVVKPQSYGAALIYFTGSKAHNIAIRKIALQKKLKINEYGVFKEKQQIAGKTEEEVYKKIDLAYIEPEMRENVGEIELAKINKLPTLIKQNDIRGDLHSHTIATDGNDSIADMAKKAKELGYEYLAITDHSKHLAMINGLNEKKLLNQIKQIDQLNAKLKGITILKSIEMDILENGKLDLSNAVLKELDFTVCSIHSKFHLTKKQQTERILRAMDNPFFNILAHPTGRLINEREPYELDIEKIMLGAKERNCFLELNAQPERMDLNESYCKLAKELQLKIAISTDAHSVAQMDLMRFGVYQARRGWLGPEDVINSLNLKMLLKAFKR